MQKRRRGRAKYRRAVFHRRPLCYNANNSEHKFQAGMNAGFENRFIPRRIT